MSDKLQGYATALCDVYRSGGCDYSEWLFKESGLSLPEWLKKTDLTEDDLEILRKVFEDE